MIKTIALGCRMSFGYEERNETYFMYVEVSTTVANGIMRQELPWRGQLRWTAGGRGA